MRLFKRKIYYAIVILFYYWLMTSKLKKTIEEYLNR